MARETEPGRQAVPDGGGSKGSSPGGPLPHSTGRKLRFAFGIHIAVLLVLGLTVLWLSRMVWLHLSQSLNAAQPRIAAAQGLESAILTYSLQVQAVASARHPGVRGKIPEITSRVENCLAEYQRTANTRRRREKVESLASQWQKLHESGTRLLGGQQPPPTDDIQRFDEEAAALATYIQDEILPAAGGTLVKLMETAYGDLKQAAVLTALLLVAGTALSVTISLAVGRTVVRSEAALRASEERFRALVQASSDVVYRMSADWSEMRLLVGRDFIADTMESSRTWLQKYILPDDQPPVIAVINEAIRKKGAFELEHRVIRVDGSIGWTFSRAIPMLDADGQVVEWFGMAKDVTARKDAEAALMEKQTLLQAVLDYSPTLISIKDLEGNVILANRNFSVLDAPPLHELIGRNVFELFPEEVARELWQNDRTALKLGGPFESEETVKHKDGQWHTYLTVKFPVFREAGVPFGICAISTDITERKQVVEALREAHDRLEQRVAERTAELGLANERLTREVAERAALQEELVIASERERERVGQNLHDGLCQILTAARFKMDSLVARLEPASPLEQKARSIAALVAQAVDEARGLARGLEPVEPLPEGLMAALQQLAASTSRLFSVSCECEFPQPVLVSDHQVAVELFRVAQEATHNGIKHGSADTIRIRLVEGAEAMVLTVTNNGRLFSPDPAAQGMGLKTMRYRCERIGAQFKIEPGVECGAVVLCTLPKARPGSEKEETQ